MLGSADTVAIRDFFEEGGPEIDFEPGMASYIFLRACLWVSVFDGF